MNRTPLLPLSSKLARVAGLALLVAGLAGVPDARAAGARRDSLAGAARLRDARRPAAGAAAARAAKPAAPAPAARTLDPVHIEGELDVPEVLFITARDQRRAIGFQHGRYRKSSLELARETPLPSHVVPGRAATPPAGAPK